ncbi:DMT family transporter [Luteibacter yeojuensis]|uniref:Multidrug DMT transporter permease n=1 Tax=Luteibacter yeojuensis TaxID=345309 RepID=A0A0F3KFJ5_9GAMM|nr:DMT family transporter [Luteibacter yeojuensis]KJV28889.1 multidrug DMT transporter permease [Luteibacter yeojuensis]
MDGKANIPLGILFGIIAGALWGTVFVAPQLARDFTGLQLAAGRYLVYGAISAVLLVPRWPRLRAWLEPRHWRALVGLSLLANIVYYVALATAVQWGGVAMASLVIGFLPVVVTVVGSRAVGAVPLRRLAPSLVFSAIAIACIGGQALVGGGGFEWRRAAGFLCAVAALVSWTIYALRNARWLHQLPHVSAHDWNLLTGLVTGALSLLLVPAALYFDASTHTAAAWSRFAAISAGMAVFASILGNSFWNRMSRMLPLTLVGQMILFETLFALLYGFVWEWRVPVASEWVAMVCVGLSVVSCLHAHKK